MKFMYGLKVRTAALIFLVLAAAAHRCFALLVFWPDVIGYFGHEGAADVPLWFLQEHKSSQTRQGVSVARHRGSG